MYIYINMQNMMSPDPEVAKHWPSINADLQVMHMYRVYTGYTCTELF